ncbi:hypothetical protein O3P69_007091 [Scylla paramamosain]|uniref:Uncharacterized protein n=1 Tax=Scylla paramamosain TaxID=85552 RepID=A0AAW0V5J4_SCYPA
MSSAESRIVLLPCQVDGTGSTGVPSWCLCCNLNSVGGLRLYHHYSSTSRSPPRSMSQENSTKEHSPSSPLDVWAWAPTQDEDHEGIGRPHNATRHSQPTPVKKRAMRHGK